ncbi:MAG: glycosyltransferase family 4 protein, partial [FCB group bacterium]|nr:glycosyltransferase family 4 protein [FCB group bacterium]
ELLVVLVGRINRWKGQKLLVDAADILYKKGIRHIRYLIVGDPPKGQTEYLRKLQESIERSGISAIVKLEKFRKNIARIWKACDICVVPSIEPEPFGLVAVEAMQFGKPVIAADHGGLQDIVLHETTGLKFRPGDAFALANALERMQINPNERTQFGKAGYQRYLGEYSEERFISQFEHLYVEMI